MASRNIFSATPPSTKRKTVEYTHGEVVGKCLVCPGDVDVVRCCATFGGCENYAKEGCKFKISILSIASPCRACNTDIKPGQLCLGVPNPNGTKSRTGKQAYVNTHLKWEDCLGHRLKLGREGKTAFKFIEKVDADDDRLDVPCLNCGVPIIDGDFVITTYQPNAVPPMPTNPPLHAKECARKVFEDIIGQFVDNMQLEGIDSNKVVEAESLDFDF